MDLKYIKLLVDKCTELDKKQSLFINYNSEIKEFVLKLVSYVKELGINDIYLDEYDQVKVHDLLMNININEIDKCSEFDCSIWDTYAKKDACFLIIETEYPGLMDDIDSLKISRMAQVKRDSRPLYRSMVEKCTLSWSIVAYPSKCWADSLFDDSNSYQLLKDAIYKICKVDSEAPILEWDKHFLKLDKVINKLNSLDLVSLHYKNSLGTDLEVFLPNNYLFSSAKDRNMMVNMPSYEVFASPLYNKTNGIVYSTKPLNYAGSIIDDFYLRFEEGKVIDYEAKKGKEILKSIIETDNNSCYLGECALVENSSPIAKLGMTFGTTLIDENASCHLALGDGFFECIKDGLDMSIEELMQSGINHSKAHVDFMIGSDDLNIMGKTREGKSIPIMVNGNYAEDLLL